MHAFSSYLIREATEGQSPDLLPIILHLSLIYPPSTPHLSPIYLSFFIFGLTAILSRTWTMSSGPGLNPQHHILTASQAFQLSCTAKEPPGFQVLLTLPLASSGGRSHSIRQ